MTNIDFAALPDAEAARLMAEMDGLSPRPYTTSLDAAVAWLGRMGLEWSRQLSLNAVHVSNGTSWYTYYEDKCPTARALCNAGWAAVQAMEGE